MRVIRGSKHCPASSYHSVLTIGNFDGVHLGHQDILARGKKLAAEKNAPLALLTFHPHPARILRPDAPRENLTTIRGKLLLLKKHGVDTVIFERFTKTLAALSAREFFTQFLLTALKTSHIIIGSDFIFGRGREGNVALLSELCHEHKIGLTIIETHNEENHKAISSTAIRSALKEGDVTHATALLGRSPTLFGRVVHGDNRGAALGFPTANLKCHGQLAPLEGVYSVFAHVDGARIEGVAHLGPRPTFDSAAPTIEVHLMNFNQSLYGKRVTISFLNRIRGVERFADKEALIAQIKKDIEAAKIHFKNHE